MKILHISDTHNRHHDIGTLPEADIVIHSGDFTDRGTEAEALDFLNWWIELPHRHKLFVTGNHDLCLWDALDIEDLPANVHFLQDKACTIEGISFFGLGYNHSELLIPMGIDVLITHEPPYMILDESSGMHWGNFLLRHQVLSTCPRLHCFGHAHESHGTATLLAGNEFEMTRSNSSGLLELPQTTMPQLLQSAVSSEDLATLQEVKLTKGITFSNGSVLDDCYQLAFPLHLIEVDARH